MKKAFTLIELLVVIAIIAILAAILFPVFAQAKAAAKATASISNAKQISLGAIQYGADVDDVFVPGQINTTETGSISLGGSTSIKPWTQLIDPYVKNVDIYRDPLGPSPTKFTDLPAQMSAWLTPHYGLNAFNLSTFGATGYLTKSMTEPANPADTVLLTSIAGYEEWTSPGFTGVNVSSTWIGIYNFLSHPPLSTISANRNWGKNSSWDAGIKTVATGRYTGGSALRASNNAVVAFVDGHVGKRAPGALAIGTAFRFDATGANQSLNTAITNESTDLSKYLWDTQ
jgi:prepilin-type N-terminal cleavage/methylation domain-containing protein/prepilin-type processing-associated H-X9-DG protein